MVLAALGLGLLWGVVQRVQPNPIDVDDWVSEIDCEAFTKGAPVKIGLRTDQHGNVVDAWVEHGSGSSYFDRYALRHVRTSFEIPYGVVPYNRRFTVDVQRNAHQNCAQPEPR